MNLTKYSYDILVAKCGRPIGLNGIVKLVLYTDFKDIFKEGIRFLCGDRLLTLDKFNIHKTSAKFKEINSIDSAKLINSHMLYVSKEDTIKYCHIMDEEYFWFDIIGCSIVDNGILIGVVKDIIRMGSIDYLMIKPNSINNKMDTFLVPYIDRYIIGVDIKTREIKTVDAIGILENS